MCSRAKKKQKNLENRGGKISNVQEFMIYEFMEILCEWLDIDIPILSFNTSKFSSATMGAQLHPTGKTLYLKWEGKVTIDIFFNVAHELRHAWQIKNDWQLYLSSYRPVELCSSNEEYNSQLAEVDAHAFAAIALIDIFGVKPLFKNFSKDLKQKIFNRMDYIIENEWNFSDDYDLAIEFI